MDNVLYEDYLSEEEDNLLEILTNEVAKNSVVLEKGQIPIMKEKKTQRTKKYKKKFLRKQAKKSILRR
jgi:hypothetical protein